MRPRARGEPHPPVHHYCFFLGGVVWGCFRGLLGVWRCFLVGFVSGLLLNSYCSATGLLDWAWGLFWWFSLEGILLLMGLGMRREISPLVALSNPTEPAFLLHAYVNLVEGVRVARLKYVSNAGSVDEKN